MEVRSKENSHEPTCDSEPEDMAAQPKYQPGRRSFYRAVWWNVYFPVWWLLDVAVRRTIHFPIWRNVDFPVRRIIDISIWRSLDFSVRRTVHFTIRRTLHLPVWWAVDIFRWRYVHFFEHLQEQYSTVALFSKRTGSARISLGIETDSSTLAKLLVARKFFSISPLTSGSMALRVRLFTPVSRYWVS